MKAINYFIWHFHVQSQQKQKNEKEKLMKHWNNVSNRFKVNNKDTRTTTAASIVKL